MSYGHLVKRVFFLETDKRHADLRLRLRHDGLKQQEFFNSLVTGYIERDKRILDYVQELKFNLAKQGKNRIRRSASLLENGSELEKLYNLTDEERENIFDLLEQELES